MNTLLNQFIKLDVDVKLKMLLEYFNKKNTDTTKRITNIELSSQMTQNYSGYKHFVTVTTSKANMCNVKEEITLKSIIEDLLLNSEEELERREKSYNSDVENAKKKISVIEDIKVSILKIKNRFDPMLFEKSNNMLRQSEIALKEQIGRLDFKSMILNFDSIYENEYNIIEVLRPSNKGEDNHRNCRELIKMINRWHSSGLIYYSKPVKEYHGAFIFNQNERMYFQVKLSSFNDEINDIFEEYMSEINLPSKTLRHNSNNFISHLIIFDDFKSWLIGRDEYKK